MIWNLRVLSKELMVQTLSCSTRELFQHWTKSSRIPASRKGQSGGNDSSKKDDRFLRGRQIAYLIYEYFWVTGANDSVENYVDLFTIVLRNDDIQEFDSKWDEILWRKFTWWNLGRIVQIKNTRVWETQNRIGIVQYRDSSGESWTW